MTDRQQSQALQDLNVLDFGWSVAGPLATKYLSDYGATVVKVESMQRLDIGRTYYPMAGNKPGINRCGFFDKFATGKYSIGLNLNVSRGIEIAKKLVAWTDVVLENFTAGTMEKWGLDYPNLVKIKPDIIMVSMSVLGQTGPLAKQSAFGTMLQSYAGFTETIGWPDRRPTGSPRPITDYIAAWYAVVAILGAIEYRRRTGEGQFIDLSQHEAGVTFLSPAILDYVVNGRIARPMGNRSTNAVPHGAYRCRGNDRWCVIAVTDDEGWHSLCQVMDNPEWLSGPKFATHLARKENEDELDKLIGAWTINQSPEEVMWRLQKAGVPAGIVADAEDLVQDPQLAHRHHYVRLDHPEMGVHLYSKPSGILSETPAEIRRSPLFGEHNEYVYTKSLGLSDEEFVELLQAGVLE
jgi:crotonobetainyl-CoA:carnitine CoA-transferase CaiB-like acyl-CoA transferase